MRELKKKKYFAFMLIFIITLSIIGITKISNYDFNGGKVKISKAYLSKASSKLQANVTSAGSSNEVVSKGYDEISYKIKYTLSGEDNIETRPVTIVASLDKNEKYAYFKDITKENVSSVLSDDLKTIEITINNARVSEENSIDVKMIIQGAPNGYTLTPTIKIKESTEENYRNVSVSNVTVITNSLTGIVTDEDNMPISNVLVSLVKNKEQIKETYTKEDGSYSFTDIEQGKYEVVIDEEIYELVSKKDIEINNGSSLNLTLKKVTPYQIKTSKYISKIKITNNNVKYEFNYGELSIVQQSIRNLKKLSGEVYYKITVENKGSKQGVVTVIKDEIPDGLSFNSKKNAGWEEENGVIYNRSLEGLTLKSKQKVETTLVLDIKETNEARNYINKVTAKGEVYEKVVFILDGRTYKEQEVLEGETIKEVVIDSSSFSGWYTDRKYTNKYNFKNPVTKDLILYGKSKNQFNIVFNDKNPETGEIVEWSTQKVEEGSTLTKPTDPNHTGYTFDCWEENGVVWDFENVVSKDMTLTSCYKKNKYVVEYYDDNNKVDEQIYEYKDLIDSSRTPSVTKEGYTFTYWSLKNNNEAYDFSTPITEDIELYSNYTINKNEVIFNDENRITEKVVDYGSLVAPIASKGKTGHTFKYWSLDGETEFDFSTPIIQTTLLYAVYDINKYTVIINDKNPKTSIITKLDEQTINYGSKATEPSVPEKEGYTFKYFVDQDENIFDFDTSITKNYTLETVYEKKSYTVRFIDEGNLYSTSTVKYEEKVTKPTDPSKANNIFLGWTYNDSLYDFNSQVTKDMTLYSRYEEVVKPTITHTPTAWTNDKVTVTITSSHQDYTYKYKIDDGQILDYTHPFDVYENSVVVAYSVKSSVTSLPEVHPITNIDKISPVINSLDISDIQKRSSKVSFGTIDNESGMKNVKIYLDDVYVTDINYDSNYNEEKISSYDFTNLTPGTTYRVKIIATDVAGNQTVSDIVEFETEEDIIIARIIGENNTLFEEEDYINFNTLRGAIEYEDCVTNQCTIQMVLSTDESVEVLDGQDITLDVNGKTIAGVSDYTILNSGLLTIIDNNIENGVITNRTSVSIRNTDNGVLTIGENDSDVSITKPYIYGSALAVQKLSGILNFYDGKLEGRTGLYGVVDETPINYNATVNSTSENQIVTLKQIDDPEARIKSVYYTKVSTALDEAKNGLRQKKVELLQSATSDAEYRFVYNAETENLESNNNEANTTATSYINIDLSDYEEDQTLLVKARIDSIGEGTIHVYDELLNQLTPNTGNEDITSIEEETIKYKLSAGKSYKLVLTYNSPAEISGSAKMIVTNVVLDDYQLDILSNAKTGTNIKNYGFDFDIETNTLKSNNQYTPNTLAHSFVEVDLTSSNEDKEVIINAILDTYLEDFYYAYITVTTEKVNINDYHNVPGEKIANIYRYSGTGYGIIGPYNYYKTLTKGSKYYINFIYYKGTSNITKQSYIDNDCADQFIINSFDIVSKGTVTNIDLGNSLVKADDADYGYVYDTEASDYTNRYIAENETSSSLTNTVADSYVKVDLTNVSGNRSFEVDFNAYLSNNFYIAVTESTTVPNESEAIFPTAATYYGGIKHKANLESGKVNYIHFVYKRGSEDTSYYPVFINSLKILNEKVLDKKNIESFTGDVLQENSYNYDKDIAFFNNATSGSLNDSYIELDLTNETVDQILNINSEMSYKNIHYMYISDNEGGITSITKENRKNMLLYFDYTLDSYNRISNTGSYNTYTDYKYILQKGNKYYLHMVSKVNSNNYSSGYLFSLLSISLSSINNNSNNINIGDNSYIKTNKKASSIVDPDTDATVELAFDGTEDNNLRFIGSNPKNYISFNGELWRIVGVFETEDENGNKANRIKIIRNDSIATGISFDSTAFPTAGPPVNGGLGTNEYSVADIMKLLNPDYDDFKKATTIKNGNNYTPNGENLVNNSLYWNRQSGNCTNDMYNAYTSCNFTSTGLKDSAKEFIDTVVWNNGAIPYNNMTSPYSIYSYERGSNTTKSSAYQTVAVDDTATRNAKWVGKVGLPYVSDILLATGSFAPEGTISITRSACLNMANPQYGNCTNTNDWLVNGSVTYTISPVFGNNASNQPSMLSSVSMVGVVYQSGLPASSYSTVSGAQIKPTLYLSTKTKITGGKGTSSQPYQISLGDTDNDDEYYGLYSDSSSEEGNVIVLDDDFDSDLVTDESIYSFEYDESTSSYINTNGNDLKSLASKYFKLDMTNESSSKNLTFEVKITSNTEDNRFYLNLFEGDNISLDYRTNNSSSYTDGLVDNIYNIGSTVKNYDITLEPGKVYYLQFVYYNGSSNSSCEITFTSENNMYEIKDYVPILNEEVDTIVLLKNISLDGSLIVPDTKNVIIDLNGKILTNQNESVVVDNNGYLTIIDSKYVDKNNSTGKITSSTYTSINNKKDAYLNIESGIVNNTSLYTNIDNDGSLSIGASGNAISTNSISILNHNYGDILDGEGYINKLSITNKDEFTGYEIDNITISSDVKIHNLNKDKIGTGIINLEKGTLLLDNNSYSEELNTEYETNAVVNSSTVDEINNSGSLTATSLNGIRLYNEDNGEAIVNNSTVSNIINYNEITTNYSNVDTLYNGNEGEVVSNNTKFVNVTNNNLVTANNSIFKNFTNHSANSKAILSDSSIEDGVIINSSTKEKSLVLNNVSMNSSDNEIINETAITNDSTGEIIIKGNSSINNYKNGIKMENGGILTIGEKDNTVNRKPRVNAIENGIIANDATIFNFYDGMIMAEKEKVISTSVNDIETNHDLYSEYDNNKETIYLVSLNDTSVDPVARIGNTKYQSLYTAIEAAANNTETEIVLLRNISTALSYEIPSTKKIKIDFDNNNLRSYNGSSLFINNGSLEIYDQNNVTGSVTSKIESFAPISFVNNSNLTYGYVETNAYSSETIGFKNNENATMIINGGSFSTKTGNTEYYNYNPFIRNLGNLTINGGVFNDNNDDTDPSRRSSVTTLECTYYECNQFMTNDGELTITGGTFNDNYVLTNFNNIKITGGTFNGEVITSNVKYNSVTSSFGNVADLTTTGNITGAEFNGRIYQLGGNIEYSGATLSKVYIGAQSTSKFSGVTINDEFTNNGNTELKSSKVNSFVTNSNGTLTITGGNYNSTINNEANLVVEDIHLETNSYGIRVKTNTGTTTTIKSGTIVATNAYYTSKANSTLTLGVEDENMSLSSPHLIGTSYGINSTDGLTLKFYDGIVEGSTAISSNTSINSLSGYEVITSDSEYGESKYLGNGNLIKNNRIPKVYDDIQSAIDEANNGDTLTMLRSYVVPSNITTFNIDSSKDITIELDGKSISKSTLYTMFNVAGKLTIKNSETTTSVISSSSGSKLFENNGTLEFMNTSTSKKSNISLETASSSSNTIINNTETLKMSFVSMNIVGSQTAINNSGTLTFNNSTINSTSSGTTLINSGQMNSLLSHVIINNGSNGLAINNSGTLTGNVLEVSISSSNSDAINNSGTLDLNGSKVDVLYGYMINNTGTITTNQYVIPSDDEEEEDTTYTNVFTMKEPVNYSNHGEKTNIINSSAGNIKFDYINVTSYNPRSLVLDNKGTVLVGTESVNRKSSFNQYYVYRAYYTSDGQNNYSDYMIKNTDSGTLTIKNAIVNRQAKTSGIVFQYNRFENYTIYSENSSLTIENTNFNTLYDGTIRVTGGTANIDRLDAVAVSEILSLKNNANVTVLDSTMNSVNNVININNASLTIKGGTILSRGGAASNYATARNKDVAIYENGGSLTIGEKDGDVSTSSPSITGTNVGLEVYLGTVNFYDGIITATTPIMGAVSYVEDGYQIIKNENSSSKYLAKQSLITLKDNSNNVRGTYNDFESAINAANSGDKLVLNREFTQISSEDKLTIDSNKNITIDLNGHDMYVSSRDEVDKVKDIDSFIDNNGTLNIIDSSNNNKKIISSTKYIINNNGNVTITGVDLEGYLNNKENKTMSLINSNMNFTRGVDNTYLIYNNGLLNIENGDFNYTTGGNYLEKIINNSSSGIVTLEGNLTINNNSITDKFITSSGIINLNNLVISSNFEEFIDDNSSVININSSELSVSNNSNYCLTNNGTINIDDSNVNVCITNNNELNINNSSNVSNIINNEKLVINDSTSNITNNENDETKVSITNSNTTLINNGNINLTSDNTFTTITNNYEANMTITKGTVTNGLVNNGNLVIGIKGNDVSITEPEISNSSNYGLTTTSTGKTYYYDGVIKGVTGSISGKIVEYESGYRINTVTENNIVISTLKLIGPDDARVAVVSNLNFDNLQAAVNYAAANNINLVTLYADIELEENLVIETGKTVTIFTNGYIINSGSYEIDEGITISDEAPNGLGGAIYNILSSITNSNKATQDIIIYEMEDGSKLNAERTYKLYKLNNGSYEIVKMNKEEEYGRYTSGNKIEEMKTVRSRLYLNSLSNGNYKLIDETGNELSFIINEDGSVSDNVIINDSNTDNYKVISSAIAELIITIQTGESIQRLLFLVILILIIVLLLYEVRKRKLRD